MLRHVDRANPPPRASVARPRLVSALDDDPGWRVAVVHARAGSGKSTGLRGWLADQHSGTFLELEAGDGHPASFVDAMASALDATPPKRVNLDSPATTVIDELLDTPDAGPQVLVIDAVEHLRDEWVQAALDAVLRSPNRPPRIVLSGRRIPRLHELAVQRVRDELIDIGDDELRLDHDEARELFELVSGLRDSDAWRAVLEVTEGWAAAFCLIAKELRSAPSRSVDDCVELAMPSMRDYLIADVFEQVAPSVVQLLLDLSVIDPVSAASCDAIRARNDSARLLRELQRETLFVERSRHDSARLRLHPLVRRILDDELAAIDAPRQRMLHNRSARWHHGQGDEVSAMRHLIAGGNLAAAWQRFRDHWAERYFAGDFQTLGGWCDLLAPHAESNVERASELAIALLLLGRLAVAEHFVVEAALALDTSDARHSAGLELARFMHADARGALDIAREHAAAARISAESYDVALWRRSRASLVLSSVLSLSGRPGEAQAELQRALVSEDPTSPVEAVLFPSALARVALDQGRLSDAADHASRAVDAAALLPSASGALLCGALTTAGCVALERNDLAGAERDLTRALLAADALDYAPVRLLARLALARVHHARGRREAAFELLGQCRRLRGARFDHHLTDRITEVEVHLRLCQGDVGAAREAMPPQPRERLRMAEARVRAALGQHEAAVGLVSTIDVAHPQRAIRVAMVRARCTADAHTRREALASALRIAETTGYTRAVLDERLWVLPHLRTMAPGWPTRYVAALVERCAEELAGQRPSDRLARLSEREFEVWQQLSTPASLSDISRRLFISRNTMKTHVRNIYRKLEVATREAAVAVAVPPGDAEPGG